SSSCLDTSPKKSRAFAATEVPHRLMTSPELATRTFRLAPVKRPLTDGSVRNQTALREARRCWQFRRGWGDVASNVSTGALYSVSLNLRNSFVESKSPLNQTSVTQSIVILDFGAQYTQLIARRIREQNVFSVVLPCTASLKEV